jgi:N-acetylglucosamine-6-phosphate deacetylase
MRYYRQGALIPGNLADITVFDREYNIRLVMIGGKIVKGDNNETDNS